jgi:hypothetical protein
MPVITHENSKLSSRADRGPAASKLPKFIGLARMAVANGARLLKQASNAFAEARMHQAMIEAELYRNRHLIASKSDDDIPINRSVPGERPLSTVSASHNEFWPSFASVAAACRRAVRAGIAMARRAYLAVIVLALVATVLAATIAIRLAIWLPLYLGRMF